MNEEIFESVLNEILEEMKVFSLLAKDLQNTVADLKEKVTAFDQRLTEQVVAPPADTLAVQQVLKEGLNKIERLNIDSVDKINGSVTAGFQKISQLVETRAEAVLRHRRFVFYPENDNPNYRFFLSRLLLFITGTIVIGLLFVLAWQWVVRR
ncbi:MAG TPA: hypothetical protein VNS58_29390 [Puia sp.]|nr:hypothetical protein [Puia sp.]